MKVIVLNAGSSSIKYRVFDKENFLMLCHGVLEGIGKPESRLRHKWLHEKGAYEELVQQQNIPGYRAGLEWIISTAAKTCGMNDETGIFGIGHRVVHGGKAFEEPTLIDSRVVETIRSTIPLAPLHNPENLMVIEVALEKYPNVPQVAIFDTAFHQTMPDHSYLYALPYAFHSEHNIRRYGFHGTSHLYVAKQTASHLNKSLQTLNLITLHLGNGASATAIRKGESVDTSMGMTPLEGLIMGTRCGDLDPSMHFYLSRTKGLTVEEMESLFNEESGLKGVCGTNDMREIERRAGEGDSRARLAIDMYCYRIKKYIGAYFAVLGQIDALIFTGGIGENSSLIRKRSCDTLSALGIVIDNKKNESGSGRVFEIQRDGSDIKVLVVPTNEELEIARQTVETIKKIKKKSS
ncbi:MAG: acetate kinase [Nitrospirae bacterium RBG_13_43_8]|nr:MAG: acetate kinase [Nitrospirae bacterium RBG_13_43_8]